MKNSIKILAALLAVITAISCFASCGGGKNVSEDTTAEEQTTEALKGPVIFENGSVKYKIVRIETENNLIINALKPLVSALRELDKNLSYSDDYLKAGTEPDSNAYEILVGDTNRPESQAKYAELNAGDWYVGVSGNKILILGGNDDSTVDAVNYFWNAVSGNIAAGGETITLDGIATEYLYKKDYAAKEISIAGTPISEYTVRYSSFSDEEASTAADTLTSGISDTCGVTVETTKKATEGKQIIIGSCTDDTTAETKAYTDTLDYTITEKDGNITVTGGNSWGIMAGVKRILSDYVYTGTDIPAGTKITGNAAGVLIYEKYGTSNLRIMTNNVWQCDSNQSAWAAIGEDCSAKNRSIGLAKTYAACQPDIICFQEMTTTMLSYIKKNLKSYGLEYKTLSPDSDDYVPIIYNPATVTLEDSGFHLYKYGNNGNTKGYTWGYFKLNENGEHFIVLSTHLWWKSDSVEPLSSTWRKNQAQEIVDLSDELIAKYNCPMFIQGDMNCTTSSTAILAYYNGGFENNYNLATVFRDNIRGHHKCSSEGYETVMYDGTYLANGIDHMLTKNLGTNEVQAFKHIVVDFYFNLSDHFPIISDIKLGE